MYEPTKADVAEYCERGYWISSKLIDDNRIERLREAIERLFAGEVDGYGGYFGRGRTARRRAVLPRPSNSLRSWLSHFQRVRRAVQVMSPIESTVQRTS